MLAVIVVGAVQSSVDIMPAAGVELWLRVWPMAR
jgi:hypothetical protein